MKRPFAFLGFSYLIGALAAFFVGELYSLIFLIIPLLFLLLRRGSRELALSVAGFSLALLTVFLLNSFWLNGFSRYEGNEYRVRGQVTQRVWEKEGTTAYEVRILEMEGEKVSPFTIYLYSGRQLRFTPYDEITCNMRLQRFADDRGTSSRKSYLAKGVQMTGKANGAKPMCITAVEKKPPLYAFVFVRDRMRESIDSLFSEDTADILCAMLLGEQERLSDEVYAVFKYAGISHILVISGMHMAVIAGLILFLLRRLRLPKRLTYCLSIAAIVFYMGMTGFGSSVVRSGIMYILLLVSELVGEEGDSLNSLGFAVFVICAINPFSAADLGFLLSVSATTGIICLSGSIKRRLLCWAGFKMKRRLSRVASALAVSLSAFISILPVTLYFFGTINPLSVITSTLLAIPSSALLILGILATVLGVFLAPLAAPIAICVTLLARLMLWTAALFASVGRLIPTLSQGTAVLLVIGIALVTGVLIIRKADSVQRRAWIMAVVLMTAVSMSLGGYNGAMQILVEDMGRGSVVSLIKGSRAAVLMAEGYKASSVVYRLRAQGVKTISYLHITSDEGVRMAEKLCASFEIGVILAQEQVVLGETCRKHAAAVQTYDRSYTLYPFYDDSVQVKVDIFGKLIAVSLNGKRVMIEGMGMESVPLAADLTIAGARGSNINSPFTIMPKNAIIKEKTPGKYISITNEAYRVDLSGEMKIRRLD